MSVGQSCGPESAFAGAVMEDSQINTSAAHHHYVMHLSPYPLAGKPVSVWSAENFFWGLNWMGLFYWHSEQINMIQLFYPLLPPRLKILYSF